MLAEVTDIEGKCSAGHTVSERLRDKLPQSGRALRLFLQQDLSQPADFPVWRMHAWIAG